MTASPMRALALGTLAVALVAAAGCDKSAPAKADATKTANAFSRGDVEPGPYHVVEVLRQHLRN